MLRLILTEPGGSLLGTATVANVGGYDVCDYATAVFDGRLDCLGSAVVRGYRRFSAPVHDLVLRGVCAALYGAEDCIGGRAVASPPLPPVLEIRIDLARYGDETGRRPLMSFALERDDLDAVCAVHDHERNEGRVHHLPDWPGLALPLWEAVTTLWCELLYGRPLVTLRQRGTR